MQIFGFVAIWPSLQLTAPSISLLAVQLIAITEYKFFKDVGRHSEGESLGAMEKKGLAMTLVQRQDFLL